MATKFYQQIIFLILFQTYHCLIPNPTIGILTESNIYLAQILEFNSTIDQYYLFYHHNDPVYSLQSFTFDDFLQEIYICTPTTIYTLDLRIGSKLNPLLPIDDTPCRTSLIYLSNEKKLLWALRHSIIHLDFQKMFKTYLWNTTSLITNIIYNHTYNENYIEFYLSIQISNHRSSILYCRLNRTSTIFTFQTCFFIDHDYYDISSLIIHKNFLYIADRLIKKIYALTIVNNSLRTKIILPLNTSTIADIQSMLIYQEYLIWLTTSGHIRMVSLNTYQVRNLFWFDEQLTALKLVSFSQWPQPKTTTTTSTTTMNTSTTSVSTQINSLDNNSWKITAYVTSILSGLTLFLCAAMTTCALLNYRAGRTVPNSFTNIFHILRNRTETIATITTARPLSDQFSI